MKTWIDETWPDSYWFNGSNQETVKEALSKFRDEARKRAGGDWMDATGKAASQAHAMESIFKEIGLT